MRSTLPCARCCLTAAGSPMWLAVPFRLVSESIRNCPETTTFWPACNPLRTSVMPLAVPAVSTSTAWNFPPSSATMTTLRVPVRITASAGTSSTSAPGAAAIFNEANMPGISCPSGLASSTRAFSVRVAVSTCGRTAPTLPWNTAPGSAGLVALTALPGRTCAAAVSGMSASTQTVARPLMRNKGVPGATAMPSRAPSSAITPAAGAVTVSCARTSPVLSTCRTWASVMPARRMRWRAASATPARPEPCMRLAARNSSWAAIHSGTYSSSRGCPARTASSGARTNWRST